MTTHPNGTPADWADVARRKYDHYQKLAAGGPQNDIALSHHERGLVNLVPHLVEALDETLAQLPDLAELETHVAKLRTLLAEHDVEDPTWAGLSQRQKDVLMAADAARLGANR